MAGDAIVVLREYLPGQPLGEVPVTCASAWRSAGETLARIHQIRLSADDRAGMIAGREFGRSRRGAGAGGSWRTP
jgi:hypothetical protein